MTDQVAATVVSGDVQPPDETGVPAAIRAQAAEAHEHVYPAVKEGRFTDAAAAGRQVLTLLEVYPNAYRDLAFCMELAWAYFAVGMEAKSLGRLDEAIACFDSALRVLPPKYQHGSLPLEALNQRTLVYLEKGDLSRSIDGYRELLAHIEREQFPVNKWVFSFGLGRLLERRGGPDDRAKAIHAYAQAIRSQPAGDPASWTHEACAGIVRCCFDLSPSETRPFWACWMQGWRRIWFMGLVAVVVILYGFAIYHMSLGESRYAWSIVGLAALPLLIILLPGLRKASGPGWSIEMQEHPAPLGFAFDLKMPGGDD